MDNQNDNKTTLTPQEQVLENSQPVTINETEPEQPVQENGEARDTASEVKDPTQGEETTPEERDTEQGSARAMSRLEIESMIHRYLDEAEKLKNQIKSQKEMYDAAFENDAEYMEKSNQADELKKAVSAIKQRIVKDPSVVEIDSRMKSLKDDLKDVQDAISRFAEQYIEVAGTNQLMKEDGEVLQIIKNYKLVKQKRES